MPVCSLLGTAVTLEWPEVHEDPSAESLSFLSFRSFQAELGKLTLERASPLPRPPPPSLPSLLLLPPVAVLAAPPVSLLLPATFPDICDPIADAIRGEAAAARRRCRRMCMALEASATGSGGGGSCDIGWFIRIATCI